MNTNYISGISHSKNQTGCHRGNRAQSAIPKWMQKAREEVTTVPRRAESEKRMLPSFIQAKEEPREYFKRPLANNDKNIVIVNLRQKDNPILRLTNFRY